MARRNIVAALFLIAVVVWYGVMTAALPDRTLPHTPGPSFFPWIVAGGLLVLSIMLLIQGLRKAGGDAGSDDTAVSSWRVVATLAWFGLYLLVLPRVGFVTASVPFFAGLMVLYGARTWWLVALGSVATPALLFFLFRYGFQILLPRGSWW